MEESEEEYYWLFLASIVLPTTLDSRRPSFAGQEGHGTHPTHIEGREGQSVYSERKRGTGACGTKAANRQYKVPGQSLSLSLPYWASVGSFLAGMSGRREASICYPDARGLGVRRRFPLGGIQVIS